MKEFALGQASNSPKVSIIIPVYNVEPYVGECIESVMAQDAQIPMECIVVDDRGTDNSMAVVNQLVDAYQGPIEFRIVHHQKNRGLAAARNTGIDEAKGEFVMHVDSDDWLAPNAVQLLYAKQQATNADIVSGNAIAHYIDHTAELNEPNYSSVQEMLFKTIQLTLDHVIWRRLIRRSLYTDNNIRTVEGVNIGEDHHTLPRLVYYAQKIAKVDSIVYHYNCMNPTSYMGSTGILSKRKYYNDLKSITILKDFFKSKETTLFASLINIEREYHNQIKRTAAAAGNKELYRLAYIYSNLFRAKCILRRYKNGLCIRIRQLKN